MTRGSKTRPAKVFIVYARHNGRYCQELRRQLVSLQDDGLISLFYDGEIVPGSQWNEELQKHLREAELVILLISDYFLASEYIREKEIPIVLERHDKGEAFILPVLLDSVRLPRWLRERQVVPDKPITSFQPRSTGWLEVVKSAERLLKLFATRDQAAHVGLSMMYPQQFRFVLDRALLEASTVCLCSRTGSGWYRNHASFFDRGAGSRFIFLNPDGGTFEMDSLLQWRGMPQLSGFVGTVKERRRRARERYDEFFGKGHLVRVSDMIMPGVFWIVETGGLEREGAVVFLEVPVHREFYAGNLYIEIRERNFVVTYRKIFDALWDNSRQWSLDGLSV